MDPPGASGPAAVAKEDDHRFWAVQRYARDLAFTEETITEALKKVDSPDANNVLDILLEVSARNEQPNDFRVASTSSLHTSSDKDSSSSCYSSFAPFDMPSSSDQSLESLSGLANPPSQAPTQSSLRNIYIDGSNVARSHGKDASFSWVGIKICSDWFISRKHKVKVFVPSDRCDRASTDPTSQQILAYLVNLDALVKTPTGRNDDVFVIEAARQNDGIIVSNDHFRDEKRSKDDLERFIHMNRLPYVFVDDLFIPASDPRGRTGPTLDQFLRHQTPHSRLVSLNHAKVYRSKSNHQRYQRNSQSLKICRYNQNPNHIQGNKLNSLQHKSLQLTRSLPIDQSIPPSRLFSTQADNQPEFSSAGEQQFAINTPLVSFEEQAHTNRTSGLQERYRKQHIQRAISLGYSTCKANKDHELEEMTPDHAEKESKAKHLALYKTKSHNVQ